MATPDKTASDITDEIPDLVGTAPESALQVFFFYRLTLSSLLAFLFFSQYGPSLLGRYDSQLFALTSASYVGFVLASGLVLYLSPKIPHQNHVFMMVFVDIAAITLIMHASGGVETGLGMLLAFSIAAGSLITQGRLAGLYAALASLAILTEQIYADLQGAFDTTAYTQTGILGGAFFAIAGLAYFFSLRLHQSEELVTQKALDLVNLEQLNDYVIQHMRTGIVVADEEDNIRLMNEAAWYLLGMPEYGTGHHLEQSNHELAQQVMHWKSDSSFEQKPFRPTSSGRELVAGFSKLGTGGENGTVIFLEDAANATQQAQQMKLASLGRLTASIAHEIRNPLGAISHAQQLLKESPDLPAADQRLIEIISTNSQRVNDVIENILQLSRRDRSRPESIELLTWLTKLREELILTLDITADNLQLQVEPQDSHAYADPSQLRQILIILCENACNHFNRDKQELRLQINGGITREIGGPFIDIIDNGPGIDLVTVKQIFEPFFTTQNSGTGLGLYIAKELSESNRLGLEYINIPTGGSCFRITFPAKG
jgi:two-component system sensor histidine kinase PilS (NtrC family)